MDKPSGNEPSRPELTPAAALLASIAAHADHHIVKMTPLRAVLPLVAAWVRSTESHLEQLDRDRFKFHCPTCGKFLIETFVPVAALLPMKLTCSCGFCLEMT